MHCGHPEHVHGAEDMMARVENACSERGLRLTPLRRKVYALITEHGRPVKAYDLMQQVRSIEEGPAAPPTVYRALDFLIAHGFVHRLETLNAYVPCPHPQEEAHGSQFLICERCLQTRELDDSSIQLRLQQQARAQGFEPNRHTVEVYGLCAQCQGER